MDTADQAPQTPEKMSSEQRKIIALYLLFFGSIILGVLPSLYTALFSVVLLAVSMTAIYLLREHSTNDSFSKSHAIFLIRTFWTANLYLVISTVGSVLIFLMFVKLSPLNPCVHTVMDHAESILLSNDYTLLTKAVAPCEEKFMALNDKVIFICVILAAFPVLAYLTARFTRGFRKAVLDRNI
ncbi:MAG: hypothetical protein KDI13_09690 [Alphaproteobacteria bacterium]|nr:hypothetical protein [Alphaproteobacteria bacterium]